MSAVAIPGHLHFDATVFVAMDLSVGRPGDHCVLVARYLRAGHDQRRSKRHIPRCDDKLIVVAGGDAIVISVRRRFLKDLRLLP